MFREDAVAIYHTHSPLAVLASLGAGQSFSASHLQMVKAMRGPTWSDTLQVNIQPISVYYYLDNMYPRIAFQSNCLFCKLFSTGPIKHIVETISNHDPSAAHH